MRAVALVAVLVGCGSRVDVEAADSAITDTSDTSASDTAVSPVDSAIMDVVRDTFADTGVLDTGPLKGWPITAKQADCMGFTSPVCASCHFRDGTWFLMPVDVPPPPPGTGSEPGAYERCGLK